AWIAAHGGRHIALAGRKPPSREARECIAAIECAGTKVRVFSADAADEPQVRSMITTIANEMPPLAGVFHLAAQTGASLLQNLDPFSLENAMRAKAGGAWVLHRELHSVDLDFFVLFSSSSVVLGQQGLAGYSAA